MTCHCKELCNWCLEQRVKLLRNRARWQPSLMTNDLRAELMILRAQLQDAQGEQE